jgi:formate dehydrogenase subunit delta
MNKQHLIVMANQIGQFFESMPDRAEAEAGIANHIKKFWEPRMRSALLAAHDAQETGDLRDIVKSTLTSRRSEVA